MSDLDLCSSVASGRPAPERRRKKQREAGLWSGLYREESPYSDYAFPHVTVVVPTHNSDKSISRTLDSIVKQNYPDLEIFVVDAGSTDRTVEIVRNYYGGRVRLYSVAGDHLYQMINKGISLATGAYINFLYPGDFYLQNDVVQWMMGLAIDHELPDLVYAGAMLRDKAADAKILFRPFDLQLLRQGKQPTNLQSCWFRKELFEEIGRFQPRFGMRGGLDFFCRFALHGDLQAVSTSRVVTDHEQRVLTRQMIVRHFWETLHVMWAHFGMMATLRWLCRQRDSYRLLRSWLRSLRLAFVGQ